MNTFGKTAKEDVSLFTNHIKKLLPKGDQKDILLSYMAACVQYPNTKFKWHPMLVGTPGNGKTIISEYLTSLLEENRSTAATHRQHSPRRLKRAIATTNADDIEKYQNNRGICILHTAQKNSSDLENDKMDRNYFKNLFEWLEKDDHATVNRYLCEYKINEKYNPTLDFPAN